MFSKSFSKIPKKYVKNYNLNNRGKCYFVDVYNKRGEMTWSGCYTRKVDAISNAKMISKEVGNRGQVNLHQYELRKR